MLPYLDEHTTTIETDPEDGWRALVEVVDGAFSRRRAVAYARIVGCNPSTASGPRPLQRGSTIPGFRVVAADPAVELVLEGRHRFSTYALTFRLEQVDSGRSRLRAETRAAFGGMPGFMYRLLVVGTGGHVRVVQHLLASIRRRAEGHTPTRA